VASGAATAIYLTQRRRYNASYKGVINEKVDANIHAVLWTAAATATLGALGVVFTLAL
jgi:hypothetical protein